MTVEQGATLTELAGLPDFDASPKGPPAAPSTPAAPTKNKKPRAEKRSKAERVPAPPHFGVGDREVVLVQEAHPVVLPDGELEDVARLLEHDDRVGGLPALDQEHAEVRQAPGVPRMPLPEDAPEGVARLAQHRLGLLVLPVLQEKVREVAERLRKVGVRLVFSGLKYQVYRIFEKANLVEELGSDVFYSDKESALRALQNETVECERDRAAARA